MMPFRPSRSAFEPYAILLACGFLLFTSDKTPSLWILLPFCIWAVFRLILQYRSYSVDETGLTVCYLGLFREKLLWSEMTSMVLTEMMTRRKSNVSRRLAIRISFTEEAFSPADPKTASDHDRRDLSVDTFYSDLNFRRVILLAPTVSNISKLEEITGRKIPLY